MEMSNATTDNILKNSQTQPKNYQSMQPSTSSAGRSRNSVSVNGKIRHSSVNGKVRQSSFNGKISHSSAALTSQEVNQRAMKAYKTVVNCQRGQVVCLVFTFLFFVTACYCESLAVNTAMLYFRTKCILNAEWKVQTRITKRPYGEFYNATTGKPSTEHWCNVTQYGFASAGISAFIMCWFFILFRPVKQAFIYKYAISNFLFLQC